MGLQLLSDADAAGLRPHLGVAKAEGESFSNVITPSLKDSK